MNQTVEHAFLNSQSLADHCNLASLFNWFYPYQTTPDQTKKPEIEEDLNKWLKRFDGKTVGNQKYLKQLHQQRQQYIEATGGRLLTFSTAWRFIPGMGNQHPLENGLHWHPSYDVPYLPGASNKGLLRAFALHWEGWDVAKVEPLFGKQSKKASLGHNDPAELSSYMGDLIFGDLLPITPVRLMVDVMTPHQHGWYAKGATIDNLNEYEKIPAPWHNPKPLPFVVVEQGCFSVYVQSRSGQTDLDEIESLLVEGLKIAGAGAKTASGYGRFQRGES